MVSLNSSNHLFLQRQMSKSKCLLGHVGWQVGLWSPVFKRHLQEGTVLRTNDTYINKTTLVVRVFFSCNILPFVSTLFSKPGNEFWWLIFDSSDSDQAVKKHSKLFFVNDCWDCLITLMVKWRVFPGSSL